MTGPDEIERKAAERLAGLLDAYGADARRWPSAEREDHARALAAAGLEGKVAEARALDRLLDLASRPAPPAGAAERLVALAQPGARAGNVTDLAGRSRRGRAPASPFSLPALSALAASLLLGLYLGSTGLTEDLLPDPSAERTEVAQIYDFDVLDGTLGFLTEQEDT